MAHRTYSGTMTQGREPDWQPLLDLVGEEVVADFMWMFEVRLSTGARLHAYKHIDTRRYIHLDPTGKAFFYTLRGRYCRTDAAVVLAEIFAPLVGLVGVTARQLANSWTVVADLSPRLEPPPVDTHWQV